MIDLISINFAEAMNTNGWLVDSIKFWVTPIIATAMGAFVYTRRQRAANRHVLHALWEETRLINMDCLQWRDGFDRNRLHHKLHEDDEYRPYSINYTSSQAAIEKLISDLPGIDGELVQAGVRYHYDDGNAVAIIAAIGSNLWPQYSTYQRLDIVDTANECMEELRVSSRKFHRLLSEELRISQDKFVEKGVLPRGKRQ